MSSRIRAWTFPRHRPQMYAPSSADLRRVHRYYSFGRAIHPLARTVLSTMLVTPVVRRLVSGRAHLEIPFEPATFDHLLESIAVLVEQRTWGVFQSSWHGNRLIVFSFDRRARCTGVTHVAPLGESTFHPRSTSEVVMVPRGLGKLRVGDWEMETVEAIPPWHRPHPWDPEKLAAVVADVQRIVGAEIRRPQDAEPGFVPVHGDLTPWNLRLDTADRPWLLDWEWAGWGPIHTDLLRFALAHCSLSMTDPEMIVAWIGERLPAERAALAPAATYWLGHRMYQGVDARLTAERDEALVAEHTHAHVEAAALRILAQEATAS